jgi:type II secretion system protein G
MNMLTRRKWEGVLSLVWACAGFLAFKFDLLRSIPILFGYLILFGAWWGMALLLAISGSSSKSFPGVTTSIGTFILFFYFIWSLMPKVGSVHASHPRYGDARIEISQLSTALEAFRVDNGYYPNGADGLQDLVRQPVGTTNWHGPYFEPIPKDPWGHPYFYECPGKHTNWGFPFDVWSSGPPGGTNPIANWTALRLK